MLIPLVRRLRGLGVGRLSRGPGRSLVKHNPRGRHLTKDTTAPRNRAGWRNECRWTCVFSRCRCGLLKYRFGTGGRPLGSPGRLCSAASGIQLAGRPREGAVGHCTTVGTPRRCGSGREECWSFVEIAVAGMWSLTPPSIREACSEIPRDFPGSPQVSAKLRRRPVRPLPQTT